MPRREKGEVFSNVSKRVRPPTQQKNRGVSIPKRVRMPVAGFDRISTWWKKQRNETLQIVVLASRVNNVVGMIYDRKDDVEGIT